jgi:hypothetical protein
MLKYNEERRLRASSLKQIKNSPKWVKWRIDNPDVEGEDAAHFRIGKALDTLLTDPDAFDDNFYVTVVARPKGLMCKFIDQLPLNLTKTSDTELYRQAYDTAGYAQNISTVIRNLWSVDKNLDYYKARIAAGSKTVLSGDEYENSYAM